VEEHLMTSHDIEVLFQFLLTFIVIWIFRYIRRQK